MVLLYTLMCQCGDVVTLAEREAEFTRQDRLCAEYLGFSNRCHSFAERTGGTDDDGIYGKDARSRLVFAVLN